MSTGQYIALKSHLAETSHRLYSVICTSHTHTVKLYNVLITGSECLLYARRNTLRWLFFLKTKSLECSWRALCSFVLNSERRLCGYWVIINRVAFRNFYRFTLDVFLRNKNKPDVVSFAPVQMARVCWLLDHVLSTLQEALNLKSNYRAWKKPCNWHELTAYSDGNI